MPYASVFPVSQLFTSPLAVNLTYGGSVYKCIYEKEDASDELNGENYRITAEVQASTAVLISDGDTVTINSISYKVAYRSETNIGTVILYLSQADMVTPEVSVGSELLANINFSSAVWNTGGGATKAANLATLPTDGAVITYADYVTVTEGNTYRLRIVVEEIETGTIRITDVNNYSFTFFIETAGTHDLYFTARFYYLGFIGLTAINNTTAIKVSSVSLKEVL